MRMLLTLNIGHFQIGSLLIRLINAVTVNIQDIMQHISLKPLC